jgi:antitoxin HigA-1
MLKVPVHPGEILAEELAEREISATELARQINVPANRISQILRGKRMLTGDTALRLGHWFGMNPQFWMNLQSQYDLAVAFQHSSAEINKLPTLAA